MNCRFAKAVVVVSMVLSFGLCCSPPRLLAQQGTAKPPTGWMSTALEDVLKTKYQPLKNFQNFQSWLGDPNERTVPELESNLKSVIAWRDVEAKNWKALQGARRAGVARAPFDPQINAARLMQVARERQVSIDELHAEENRQFRNAYGFNLKEGFLAHTPEEEKIAAQWMSSKAHRNFVEQEAALVKEYEARVQAVLKDYRNKTDPTEREIDRLEKETLARYQEIVKAEKLIRDALARKQNAPPPPPPEVVAGVGGSLRVQCGQSSYEAAVGETINVVVTISGGKPLYQLSMRKLDGETLLDTSLAEAGQEDVPISFDRPGTHTAYVAVRDESSPANIAQLTVSFRITGDEPAPPNPPQPPETKPQPPETKSQAPPPPQVVQQPYKPWRLAPGTYQALLWPGLNLAGIYRKSTDNRYFPIPLTVSIDAGGKVSGNATWQMPPGEMAQPNSPPNSQFTNEISFSLSGSVDWNTGAAELTLLKGRQVRCSIEPRTVAPSGVNRSRHELEFEYVFSGWQVGHPALCEAMHRVLQKSPLPDAKGDMDRFGVPTFEYVDGKLRLQGVGWAGMPELAMVGTNTQITPGPGGVAKFKLKRSAHEYTWPDRSDSSDDTEVLRKSWSEHQNWYLKILGQAPPPQTPPAAAPQTPRAVDKGELTAFGIWPIDLVTARLGEAFQVEAVGVYLDDPFEAVKLSDRVTWELPPGLTRNADGTFRAAAPGKYTVKATFRRSDGALMSDVVQVVVGP